MTTTTMYVIIIIKKKNVLTGRKWTGKQRMEKQKGFDRTGKGGLA